MCIRDRGRSNVDHTINWSTTVDNNLSEADQAKELEKNWAAAHLGSWNTNLESRGRSTTFGDSGWVSIKVFLEYFANTSQDISSKERVFEYLEVLRDTSTTETALPGSPDTILLSRQAFHEAGISPGTVLEELNSIYGESSVFT